LTPGDAIPGCYSTYIPASTGGAGLVPMAFASQPDNRSLRRIGSFRAPFSGTEGTGEEGIPFSALSSTASIPPATTTITPASSVSQSLGGGGVIFEHKTFLLLSVGLFMLGLKFKK